MVHKKKKNRIRTICAFLLLALFMSPQLFEPLHHFFISHGHENHLENHHHHWSKIPEKECPVCKFEFCSFTNELNIYTELFVPTFIFCCITSNKQIFKKSYIQNKKGRGPPLNEIRFKSIFN